MTATTVPASPARRPPPWRDVRVLRFAAQAAVVAAVVGLLDYLYDNLVTNLRIRGIPTDFDFLDRPATIEVAYSDFRASQPVRDAIVLGIKNTLLVAAIGILLTIVLGTIVGVARLSTNLLVRSAAGPVRGDAAQPAAAPCDRVRELRGVPRAAGHRRCH